MGITVGWGQDCVLDPWYSLGTADMLDVAFMGLHVAQMTHPDEMRRCFDMVTVENARIMGLDYGLREGAVASLVVLDAGNPVEALRLRPDRLCVIAKGQVVSEKARNDARLSLPGRPETVRRRHLPAPALRAPPPPRAKRSPAEGRSRWGVPPPSGPDLPRTAAGRGPAEQGRRPHVP